MTTIRCGCDGVAWRPAPPEAPLFPARVLVRPAFFSKYVSAILLPGRKRSRRLNHLKKSDLIARPPKSSRHRFDKHLPAELLVKPETLLKHGYISPLQHLLNLIQEFSNLLALGCERDHVLGRIG